MTREAARRLVMNNSRYRFINGKVLVREVSLLSMLREMQATPGPQREIKSVAAPLV